VEAIDSDGWFHTGDIGEIDLDGYLRITDRMKNIIVTSGGKNIAPAPLENQFIQSPFVEQIVIIGDRRNYLTALIVPTFEKLEQIAEGKGIQWKDRRELVSHSEINKEMDQEIKRIQASFARYEQIKKFTLLPEIFSIENGELTPSLKIKRKAVEKKFADLIDQMYR
jgi:long-chain acyl-CoA synthetase